MNRSTLPVPMGSGIPPQQKVQLRPLQTVAGIIRGDRERTTEFNLCSSQIARAQSQIIRQPGMEIGPDVKRDRRICQRRSKEPFDILSIEAQRSGDGHLLQGKQERAVPRSESSRLQPAAQFVQPLCRLETGTTVQVNQAEPARLESRVEFPRPFEMGPGEGVCRRVDLAGFGMPRQGPPCIVLRACRAAVMLGLDLRAPHSSPNWCARSAVTKGRYSSAATASGDAQLLCVTPPVSSARDNSAPDACKQNTEQGNVIAVFVGDFQWKYGGFHGMSDQKPGDAEAKQAVHACGSARPARRGRPGRTMPAASSRDRAGRESGDVVVIQAKGFQAREQL